MKKNTYLVITGVDYQSGYIVSNANGREDAKLAVIKYKRLVDHFASCKIIKTGTALPRSIFINADSPLDL